jgi:lipoate---protein ligase
VTPPSSWEVELRRDEVASLVGPWPADPAGRGRLVARCEPRSGPVLVVGSTQDADAFDPVLLADTGTGLARRDSGGGAVLVAPGAQAWLEVWVPRDDPLWDDDVLLGGLWLAEVWCRALGVLGADDLTVHRGRAVSGPWAALACFAGLGPGEVLWRGRKVVGLAQRRTRHGARFATSAPVAWRPAALAGLVRSWAVPPESGAASEMDYAAVGLDTIFGSDVAPEAVCDAVLEALP